MVKGRQKWWTTCRLDAAAWATYQVFLQTDRPLSARAVGGMMGGVVCIFVSPWFVWLMMRTWDEGSSWWPAARARPTSRTRR